MTSRRIFPTSWMYLIATACVLLGGSDRSEASYTLDGERSDVGVYAYDAALAPASPLGGDAGIQYAGFASGALMDRKDDDLGASVGLPSTKAGIGERFVFFDLGQVVQVVSVSVLSKLEAWWGLSHFQVSFSSDGKQFGNTRSHDAGYLGKYPHDEGLRVDCSINTGGVKARYVRLRQMIPAWDSVQIGEVDIVANRVGKPVGNLLLDRSELKNVIRDQTSTPIVDKFGQWTRETWPGKIQSEKQLAAIFKDEECEVPSAVRDSKRFDRFGGDKSLSIERAVAKKFRVEKIDGRWWFITPDGYPFVMIAVDGVNVIDASNSNTVRHSGKPELAKRFSWIPDLEDKRFKDCWTEPEPRIERFDYFRANLIRAFGINDHSKRFYTLAMKRLKEWGFNSLGKWTWYWGDTDTPSILEKLRVQVPYILVLGPESGNAAAAKEYREVADAWDPNYERSVENAVKSFAAKYGDDAYYMGFTIRNEGWWDGETTQTLLKAESGLPFSKKALIDRLRVSYGDIAQLNEKCGSQWKSFDELPSQNLNEYAGPLAGDISRFIGLASDRYYSAWRRAVDKCDPGRLIMGSSFVLWWNCCPEWVKGSIPYTDVMMLDWYGRDPSYVINEYVDKFAVPADKPVVLGEFGVTTMDRGFKSWHNLCPGGQPERGAVYRYVNEALYSHPNWLGTMYFIYRDQVLGGRDNDGGGESMQFGLVDNCNLPYKAFVDAVARTNSRLYGIHSGKLKPVTRKDAGLAQ